MRLFYFDIDGTILSGDSGDPKQSLAGGAFESVVRNMNFDRVVCVGSITDVINAVQKEDASYDPLDVLFRICNGIFTDESWFRENISIVQSSMERVDEIEFDHDWYYVDDMAEYYFRAVGKEEIFQLHKGKRIMVPSPEGDGRDLLDWIEGFARSLELDTE